MINKLRKAREMRTIASSGEFDDAWYRQICPDVARGASAVHHYVMVGADLGLDPNPDFSSQGYLLANPDVASAGANPFAHYLQYGRAEGRVWRPVGEPEPVEPSSRASASDIPIMAPEFDEAFYRGTNPDLATADGLLEHFAEHGWKEGRDPAPWFSVAYYLLANPDVAGAGKNPFAHYLRSGRIEGRDIQPSQMAHVALKGPAHNDAATSTGELKMGVAVMVKNEADIIRPFCEHLLALFDAVAIVDHGSSDGTLEFLQALERSVPRVRLFRLAEPGYIQALTMSHLAQTSSLFDDVDWLFFLDADEFLPFADRKELIEALHHHAAADAVSMRWTNLIPAEYEAGEVALGDGREFFAKDGSSDFVKIALNLKRVNRTSVWIEQGNHSALRLRDGLGIQAREAGFPLLHFPIRSPEQLLLKLNQGIFSYVRLGKGRNALHGAHWFVVREKIGNMPMTPALLNAVAATYGDDVSDLAPVEARQLAARGYRLRQVEVARKPLESTGFRMRQVSELIGQVAADFALELADARTESVIPPERLVTRSDGTLVRAESDSGHRFASLPETSMRWTSDRDMSDAEFLKRFLAPSYWMVDRLMPSAWGGHIPFMFALADLSRPRRYVELGTHFGASFFAFCQAAQRGGFDCVPVAIDAWEGDQHAGHYDESVFDRFKFVLSDYASFARYLRMYFTDAAKLFAPSSIDLLHIDGLHTYEAVKDDFETWLPKMSDEGVVMFHDINVHERDFGVWKLWHEISSRYPSLEFRHSHGLGVLYVGTREDSPVLRLMNLARSDIALGLLLQQHFEEMGQKMTDLFVTRFELKRLEGAVSADAASENEITRLKQELQAEKAKSAELAKAIGLLKHPSGFE